MSRLYQIPELASHLQRGSIVIQPDEVNSNTNIILGDPNRIVASLQQAESTESDVQPRPLRHLQWVHSTWAGVNVIVNNHKRDDYVLTRTCGFGPQMAEYCIGWMLFVQQKMALAQHQQREKQWDSTPFTHRGGLQGKTLGVLGVGDIGRAVARGAGVFGMRRLGLCSSEQSAAAWSEGGDDSCFDEVGGQ